MRRKSLFSSITKAFSNLIKEDPKTKKTINHKSNSQTSSIKQVSNRQSEIKQGHVYTSSGTYTRSEYNIIQETFKYAYSSDLETVDKLVDSNKSLFRPSDLHFLYNALQESLYKLRDVDRKYLEMTMEVCSRDVDLLKQGLLGNLIGAKLPCLNRLVVIYEKENMIPEAIELLRFAVENNCLGSFSTKLDRLLYKTDINNQIEKPKRVREIYNENGLCEREVKLLELLELELANRGVNVKLNHYILSNGNMEIRFDDAFVAKVKIRNNSDTYFNNTINSFNDWINNYIKQKEYQLDLINRILNK